MDNNIMIINTTTYFFDVYHELYLISSTPLAITLNKLGWEPLCVGTV